MRFLEEGLSISQFSFFVQNSYERLTELVLGQYCADIDHRELYKLGKSILENPRFSVPIVHHNVHVLLSRISMENRDFESTMRHIELALQSMYVPETIYLAVAVLNSGGRNDLSMELLRHALDRDPPTHPLQALQWRAELNNMATMLEWSEQLDVPKQ
jgi:hypothetical protein